MVVGIGGRLWRPLPTGPAGPGRAGPGRPRLDAGAVRVVDLVLALTVLLAVAGADRTFVRTPLSDLPGRCVCISGYRPGSKQKGNTICLFVPPHTRRGQNIFTNQNVPSLMRRGQNIFTKQNVPFLTKRGQKGTYKISISQPIYHEMNCSNFLTDIVFIQKPLQMIFTGFSALLLGPLWDFERIEVMGLINTIRRNMCLLKKVLNKRNDKNKRSSADQEQKWHNQQYIYKFEEVAWRTWRWRGRWRHRRRIRRRNQWYNSRAEESEDCIYRLPPPGNGVPRQANITEFFHRVDTTTQAIQSRECSEIENTAIVSKFCNGRLFTEC